jgi:hypothetical protein
VLLICSLVIHSDQSQYHVGSPTHQQCCNVFCRSVHLLLSYFLFPMSFSHLAVVEMQLCMHFLDTKSIICLARCSKFALSCASTPFAWRHANAIEIHSSPKGYFHLYNLIFPSFLLQHCRISLLIRADDGWTRLDDIRQWTSVTLDCSMDCNPTWDVRRITTCPGLRRLDLQCLMEARCAQLLSEDGCVGLQELILKPSHRSESESAPDWNKIFASLRSLKAFTLIEGMPIWWRGSPFAGASQVLTAVAHNATCLEKLTLHVVGESLLQLLVAPSPALTGVRELTVSGSATNPVLRLHAPTEDAWMVLFLSMPLLERCSLHFISKVDSCLTAVSHACPKLELLSVRCGTLDQATHTAGVQLMTAQTPSLRLVEACLTGRSKLELELELPDFSSYVNHVCGLNAALAPQHYHRVTAAFNQLSLTRHFAWCCDGWSIRKSLWQLEAEPAHEHGR